ncbi:MAG: N-acetylglucosamine kinase, partial [Hyphomicrobiales bacterium]|nr:N-acetylglucosamine kinase [Hyphomicrobiales bacterium]
MKEPLFIGVDGGATRTRARLCDPDGDKLGEATAGAGNARLKEAAITEILAACRGAAEDAGLDETDLSRVHAGLGLAGTQQAWDRDYVLAQPLPFASVEVNTDAYTALLGAHGGQDGAILIVGTGFAGLALVRSELINVGGWGADIADEGSGMMIGRNAVRRALWALEGMAPMTPLADAVLDYFDREPPNAVEWAGNATPGDFGSFAPLVFEHADKRDALAVAIIEEAARDVTRVIARLLEVGAPSIAMIGGVFPRILPWLAPPYRAVCVEPEGDPLDGA